jgi:hypothetical protein
MKEQQTTNSKIILNDVALHGVKNAQRVTTTPSPAYIKMQKESDARCIHEQYEAGKAAVRSRKCIAKTSR